jgi:hypothetical protein
MNWLKENPVIAAIAAVALLGTIATGILAVNGAAGYEQAVLELKTQASTLRRLEAKEPFPNEKNLNDLNKSINDYKTAFEDFKKKLNEEEVRGDEKITPQIFQDNLRLAVNDLRNEAKKNQVALPEKFFFGFDNYQTQLPPQGEVQKLHREFLVIKELVASIVPLGINSIDLLIRHPSPQPPAATPDPKAAPPKPDQAASEPIPFDSFTLGITAPQAAFIKAFDKIPDSPGFLVVRSMTIENSNPEPPPKAAPNQPGTAAPMAPALKPAASDQLPMIFGSESVKATILFEVPDFPAPSPESSPTPTPTPPAK